MESNHELSDANEGLDEVLDQLAKAQREVSEALARTIDLAPLAKEAIPDLFEVVSDEPLEVILREMVAARDQATEDRLQIARLVVLVERLMAAAGINASGMQRLEDAGVHVAKELAASQKRADAIEGAPGAAADAGMKSPDE